MCVSQAEWNRPLVSGLLVRRFPSASLLASQSQVGRERIGEVIGVDEILAGVVWRIDDDDLNPVGKGFLDDFLDFKIIAFDEDMLCGVEVN